MGCTKFSFVYRNIADEVRSPTLPGTSPTANYPWTIHLSASMRRVCRTEETGSDCTFIPNRTVDHNICENQHPDLCHHCKGDNYFESSQEIRGLLDGKVDGENDDSLCFSFCAGCSSKRGKFREVLKSLVRPFFSSKSPGGKSNEISGKRDFEDDSSGRNGCCCWKN